MQMIERIALGALTLWILHMGAQATSQMVGVFREESRSAHERRYRKEYALKGAPGLLDPTEKLLEIGHGSWHVA